MRAIKLYANVEKLIIKKENKRKCLSEINSLDYSIRIKETILYSDLKDFLNLTKSPSFNPCEANKNLKQNKLFNLIRENKEKFLALKNKRNGNEVLEIIVPYRNLLSFENKEHYLIKETEMYFIYSSNKRRKLKLEEIFIDVHSFGILKDAEIFSFSNKINKRNTLHAVYKKFSEKKHNQILEKIILW